MEKRRCKGCAFLRGYMQYSKLDGFSFGEIFCLSTTVTDWSHELVQAELLGRLKATWGAKRGRIGRRIISEAHEKLKE